MTGFHHVTQIDEERTASAFGESEVTRRTYESSTVVFIEHVDSICVQKQMEEEACDLQRREQAAAELEAQLQATEQDLQQRLSAAEDSEAALTQRESSLQAMAASIEANSEAAAAATTAATAAHTAAQERETAAAAAESAAATAEAASQSVADAAAAAQEAADAAQQAAEQAAADAAEREDKVAQREAAVAAETARVEAAALVVADGEKRLQGLTEKELAAAQREGTLHEQEKHVTAQQKAAEEKSVAADERQADLDARLQRLSAEEEAVSEQKVCASAGSCSHFILWLVLRSWKSLLDSCTLSRFVASSVRCFGSLIVVLFHVDHVYVLACCLCGGDFLPLLPSWADRNQAYAVFNLWTSAGVFAAKEGGVGETGG